MDSAFTDAQAIGGVSAIRVLLVEDEFLPRFETAAGLRRKGWDVVEVSSADDALELLRYQLHFDLLVTDMDMPGRLDGLGLARKARELYPQMKIVLMNADTSPQPETLAYDVTLDKPAWNDLEKLVRLIEGCRSAAE